MAMECGGWEQRTLAPEAPSLAGTESAEPVTPHLIGVHLNPGCSCTGGGALLSERFLAAFESARKPDPTENNEK